MIQQIIAIYRTKEKYGRLADGSNLSATRKEPHCPYRLMNILFSDRFAEEFAQVGNVADWVGLDTRKVANNNLFWQGVQESSEGQDEAYNYMLFMDDELLSDINLSKLVLMPGNNFEQCGRA